MGKFKITCSQCGSDNILEKSSKNKLGSVGNLDKIGEGIQRKCLECNNECFIAYKTWLQ